MNQSLKDGAMLASLYLCMPSGRKLDKAATAQTQNANDAGERSGRFNKLLFPGDALKAIENHDTLTRDVHYKMTLPWIRGGADILPTLNYFRYTDVMRQRFAERQRLIDAFITNYDAEKVEAARVLGKMYNENDYPAAIVMQGKFMHDLQFFPIPDLGDFRGALMEEHAAHLAAELTKASSSAMAALAGRIIKACTEINERFTREQPRFKDAFIRNHLELCDVADGLNFQNDPAVTQAVASLRAALNLHNVAELRGSEDKRRAVAKQADAVSTAMRAFMGVPA